MVRALPQAIATQDEPKPQAAARLLVSFHPRAAHIAPEIRSRHPTGIRSRWSMSSVDETPTYISQNAVWGPAYRSPNFCRLF